MAELSHVVLRNGSPATITGVAPVPDFPLMGRRAAGEFELWNRRGQWRESGPDHHFDIVGIRHQGAVVPFLGLVP